MIEQGTHEWRMLRLGKISGSRISDVMAKGRDGKPSVTRENYMYELATERLTNIPTESFTSPSMSWGTENEGMARTAFEVFKGVFVSELPWVAHPSITNAGCSPDGLVGNLGMVEIKCMTTANHVDAILNDKPPSQYISQCQFQLACTGRLWNDLTLFDPRLPDVLQLKVFRIERDDEFIKVMEEEVIQFLKEVDEITNNLKGM